MATSTPEPFVKEVAASLYANLRFRALKAKLPLITRKVDVTAESFRKHAESRYSEWFLTKPGHEEAVSELCHLCDVIRTYPDDTWSMLLDGTRNRVFFIHIVYTYILEVHEGQAEICGELQSHVLSDIEQVIMHQDQLFNELKMESLQRKTKVCNAVLHVIDKDALTEDYNLTIHLGIPLLRATEDAYHLVKKHFPHKQISQDSNLETLLGVIEDEIGNMEKELKTKTEEAHCSDQMLDMMRLVANQLRRQLEQKECQFQALVEKIDGMDATMKKVLEELSNPKTEKINNIEMSSTTIPQEVDRHGASDPTGKIQAYDISRAVTSGNKDQAISGSSVNKSQ